MLGGCWRKERRRTKKEAGEGEVEENDQLIREGKSKDESEEEEREGGRGEKNLWKESR